MSGTAPSAVPEVSGLPLPQLLRQETGEAGHENIAAFVNDAFGTEKSAVLSTLSKVSAAYKDGRISFEEKEPSNRKEIAIGTLCISPPIPSKF